MPLYLDEAAATDHDVNEGLGQAILLLNLVQPTRRRQYQPFQNPNQNLNQSKEIKKHARAAPGYLRVL